MLQWFGEQLRGYVTMCISCSLRSVPDLLPISQVACLYASVVVYSVTRLFDAVGISNGRWACVYTCVGNAIKDNIDIVDISQLEGECEHSECLK